MSLISRLLLVLGNSGRVVVPRLSWDWFFFSQRGSPLFPRSRFIRLLLLSLLSRLHPFPSFRSHFGLSLLASKSFFFSPLQLFLSLSPSLCLSFLLELPSLLFSQSSDFLLSQLQGNLSLSLPLSLVFSPLLFLFLFHEFFFFESLLYLLSWNSFLLCDLIDLVSPLLLLLLGLCLLCQLFFLYQLSKQFFGDHFRFVVVGFELIDDVNTFLVLLLLTNAQNRISGFVSHEKLNFQVLGEPFENLVAAIEGSDMKHRIAVLILTFVVGSLGKQRFNAVEIVIATSYCEHQWCVLTVLSNVREASLGMPVLMFHGLVLSGCSRDIIKQMLQHGQFTGIGRTSDDVWNDNILLFLWKANAATFMRHATMLFDGFVSRDASWFGSLNDEGRTPVSLVLLNQLWWV